MPELFNEAEATVASEPAPEADEITVPAHTRAKGGRKPLDDDLPRERVEHDIAEAEKLCPCGSGHCVRASARSSPSRADIEPAKVKVMQHVRFKYGPCHVCDGVFPEASESTATLAHRLRRPSAPSSAAPRHRRAAAARDHRRAAARAADPEEHRHARHVRLHRHHEVRRRPAALSAGEDPRALWPRHLACDAGLLDDPARRADRAADQPAARDPGRLRRAADGRDDGAGA